MTTDNFCFYLQNRLIQTSQKVNGTVILPPLVFPDYTIIKRLLNAPAYSAAASATWIKNVQ